jgi:hypothetical protein
LGAFLGALAIIGAAPAMALPRQITLAKCVHSVVLDAGRWGDDIRLFDLEPKFHTATGAANVRPLFEQALELLPA